MPDLDLLAKTNATFSGLFPDAPPLDAAKVRLRPADVARLFGVSRQAVGQWIAGGKLRLDVDGRVTAAAAVDQLVRNNPERLRAAALAPVVRDMAALRQRIAGLERDLAAARDEAEFQAGAASELVAQQAALLAQVESGRDILARYPAAVVLDAVAHWLRVFIDDAAPATPDSVSLLGIAAMLRGPV
jgi:transcriptional regulator with XRE-family HTH domain